MKRRNVIKAVAASTTAAGAFAGSVGAEECSNCQSESECCTGDFSAITEITFCGCSQVCVETTVPKDVYIAWKDENGEWQCDRPNSKNVLGLGDGSFCYELGDANLGYPDEAKIVGVEDRNKKFCNPNTCAQKAQAALDAQSDSQCGTNCAKGAFVCCDPEQYSIEVFTSGCGNNEGDPQRPDDPNGPPGQ